MLFRHTFQFHLSRENLNVPYRYLRAMLANVLVLFVMIFLTTPSVVMSIMNNYAMSGAKLEDSPSAFARIIPSILLVVMSNVLPNCIYWLEYYLVRNMTK